MRALVILAGCGLTLAGCSAAEADDGPSAQQKCVTYVEKAEQSVLHGGLSYREAKDQIADDYGVFSPQYEAFTQSITAQGDTGTIPSAARRTADVTGVCSAAEASPWAAH